MKLAFCLFNYFPFGGLQRDFLTIAKECVRRGHTVDVYTMKWEGPEEKGLNVTLLPNKAKQNHTQRAVFSKTVKPYLTHYDLVVGFNKMPGLHVYYAADTCYEAKARSEHRAWYRLTPRYRQTKALEEAVFNKDAATQILVLSENTQKEFSSFYHTPKERFHLLPPGIAKDRIAPPNASEMREKTRAEFNISSNQLLLLFIGSGFKTKGLDRVLQSIACLPDHLKKRTCLYVIGEDRAEKFKCLAKKLAVSSQVIFLGGRSDVARLLLAGDLLVHPAYNENTGTVLLEALVSGLPVFTTSVCGYAHYVTDAQAGQVFSSPFEQTEWNKALQNALENDITRARWKKNALLFARHADIYHLKDKAADLILQIKNPPPASFDEWISLTGEVYRAVKTRFTKRIYIQNRSYFIKQFKGCGWKEIFKNISQGRLPIFSAKTEYLALSKLKTLQVLVPDVIHYGSRGFNPATRQSYLVMSDLTHTVSLETYCDYWRISSPPFRLKQALLQRVGEIARTLHENGINHRDFYLCHFLLDQQSEELKLYLIDLHRAALRTKTPQRWIIKDLAGLYFSSKTIGLTKRDLLRFMKIYRNKSLTAIQQEEKHFWIKVEKRAEKLYQAKRNG